MNIIANLGPILTFAKDVYKYNKFIPEVDALKAAGDVDAERAYIANLTKNWSQDIFRDFDFHPEFIGVENIPEGPCVFIANHQSYFDIIGLFGMPNDHQIGFIAKEEAKKIPLVNKWILVTRGLFIRRGDSREALKSISEGAELLKQGFSLVIFPEGTRSQGPDMAPFKAGSFKLASKAKVPVVPVAIDGTYHTFEETGRFRKGQKATFTFLTPLPTDGVSRSELAEMPAKVENMIRETLEEGRQHD